MILHDVVALCRATAHPRRGKVCPWQNRSLGCCKENGWPCCSSPPLEQLKTPRHSASSPRGVFGRALGIWSPQRNGDLAGAVCCCHCPFDHCSFTMTCQR